MPGRNSCCAGSTRSWSQPWTLPRPHLSQPACVIAEVHHRLNDRHQLARLRQRARERHAGCRGRARSAARGLLQGGRRGQRGAEGGEHARQPVRRRGGAQLRQRGERVGDLRTAARRAGPSVDKPTCGHARQLWQRGCEQLVQQAPSAPTAGHSLPAAPAQLRAVGTRAARLAGLKTAAPARARTRPGGERWRGRTRPRSAARAARPTRPAPTPAP
jgi:hypothetical protein